MSLDSQRENIDIIVEENERGFETMHVLLTRLMDRHPEREYANVVRHMKGEDFQGMRTYTARAGKETVGVCAGVSKALAEGREFDCSFLLIDPAYANEKIGSRLIEVVMRTHTQCVLLPVPLGNHPGKASDYLRRPALLKYYKNLGFEPFTNGKLIKKKQVV